MGELLHSPEFWVAVAFVIFVAGIYRPVGRAAGSALDGRADKIRASLDEAEKLREDAQHLLAEYQRKQRDAMKECEEIIAQARQEAERMVRDAEIEITEALARREQMAKDKLALAEADALAEVRNAAVDVALSAAAKLIAKDLDTAAADTLVRQATEELPARLS